jgi:hypothetical protein
MLRNLSAPHTKATLSEILDHGVSLYAMAAAAAGVSVLALAQPAEAEVVYTRARIVVGSTPVLIDLNHDGTPDFQFSYVVNNSRTLNMKPLEGGAVVGGGGYASAVPGGAKIGPSVNFSPGNVVLERLYEYCFIPSTGPIACGWYYDGAWGGNPPNRYLGVKFLIDGETHYGWVRCVVVGLSGRILGYAYETDPDTPIVAHIPDDPSTGANAQGQNLGGASLGMLALGADGLALWRP